MNFFFCFFFPFSSFFFILVALNLNKELISTAADNSLIFLYFSEKIRLDIPCESSHEMPSLIYSEK